MTESLNALYGNETLDLSPQIERDLIALLDGYHSLQEMYDSELDAQIHQWYADKLREPTLWPQRPYFSPSSLGACPRELYLKAKGAKKDGFRRPPHQGRWQKIGTVIGDVIQRDLLFIEKHYEKATGTKPQFKFLRDELGRPRFEDFAKANKRVTHEGETFYLFGAPDGIMTYTTSEGKEIRVGLEVKSKQGTPAKTSHYSMKEADTKHAMQTVAYAEMYGCDYYVVLYVNAAKQGWSMTDEQYAKTPDTRAFCRRITDELKSDLFDKPASINRAVRENDPPPLDLTNWTFNNFKTACALSLSDEEYADIKSQVKAVMQSGLSDKTKRDYRDALDFITVTRTQTHSVENQGGGQ